MTWEDAWKEHRTPWDAGDSPPALKELVRSGSLPPGRALVPGCGRGYDLITLAAPGRSVLGLDIAPTAKLEFQKLCLERGLPPDIAEVQTLDFFTFQPAQPFDLIWDYTFLCALDPRERGAWRDQAHRLLSDAGELVTLLFPVDENRAPDEGPPFRLDPEQINDLFRDHFVPRQLAPVQVSHPSRQGKEWLGRWRKR